MTSRLRLDDGAQPIGVEPSVEPSGADTAGRQQAGCRPTEGWEADWTPAGRIYYVNHETRATRWTPPNYAEWPLLAVQAPKKGQPEGPMPEGWAERGLPDRTVLYVHMATNTYRSTRPVVTVAKKTNLPVVLTFADKSRNDQLTDELDRKSGEELAQLLKEGVLGTLSDKGYEVLVRTIRGRKVDKAITLIEAGAEFQSSGPNGVLNAPIMSASSAGLVPVVKALLAKDAIVYALANKNSFSALLAAHRHPECQAVILEHILVKALSDPTILNVVHESASHVTLCSDANLVDSPMHIAASQMDSSILEHMIQLKGDATKADHNGITPLHIAAGVGSIQCVKLLLQQAHVSLTALTKTLVRTIADSTDDYSPLEFAIVMKHLYIVNLLLANGANPNGHGGRVPLCLAVQYADPYYVAALLNSQADVNRVDRNGWTAAHVAAKRGKIAMLKQLLVAGANINIKATRAPKGMTVTGAAEKSSSVAMNVLRRYIKDPKSIKFSLDTYDGIGAADVITVEDDGDAFAEFHQGPTTCVACGIELEDASEMALLPCCHVLCIECALAEDEEVSCPGAVAGDSANGDITCGTRFTREQVLLPSAAVTTSDVQQDETTPVVEAIGFHCSTCDKTYSFDEPNPHTCPPSEVRPVGIDVVCMRDEAHRAAYCYCTECKYFFCSQCSHYDFISHQRKKHVNLGLGITYYQKSLRSRNEPKKYTAQQLSQIYVRLSSTLLQRQAVSLQALQDNTAIDNERRSELAGQLKAGIKANVKQLEAAYDGIIVLRDIMLMAERILLDASKPVKVRATAFSRLLRTAAKIPATVTSPVKSTPALVGGNNNGAGVRLVNLGVHIPERKKGALPVWNDAIAEVNEGDVRFMLAPYFGTYGPPRVVPKEDLVRWGPHVCIDSDGNLVQVRSEDGSSEVHVRLSTVAEGAEIRSFAVPFPGQKVTIAEVHAAHDDHGAIWVRTVENDLVLVSCRTGAIERAIRLDAALQLSAESEQMVASMCPRPDGSVVFVLTEERSKSRWLRWPVVMLTANGTLRTDDWTTEEIDNNDEVRQQHSFGADCKPYVVANDAVIIVAFARANALHRINVYSIHDGGFMCMLEDRDLELSAALSFHPLSGCLLVARGNEVKMFAFMEDKLQLRSLHNTEFTAPSLAEKAPRFHDNCFRMAPDGCSLIIKACYDRNDDAGDCQVLVYH